MAKLKLTYFDFSGRAEPTRLTFVLGDVDFIDERINREGLEERKAAGTAPTGTIPTLEVTHPSDPELPLVVVTSVANPLASFSKQ